MKPQKWVYLLAGLMPPTKTKCTEGINFEKIGIRLERIFLTEKDRIRAAHIQQAHDSRFIFYINDGIKDDNFAQRFADAVMSSLALVCDVDAGEIPAVICISEDRIKKGKLLRIKDLIGVDGIGGELYFRVMRAVGVPTETMDYVWRVVPAIVENKSLMDAAHFYKESIGQAWVADDDVFEIMQDNLDMPKSQTEMARVETAYQNAFKAIEAIIGEPPKDKRKLRMKLIEAGINPDEKVGYELYGMKPGKERLLKKLVDMHQTRDKKAAHGKTITPRTIGYCELKDKQALAQYILLSNIDAITKGLI